MEKLYYNDTYQTECECVVTSVKKTDKYTEVLTDRTVFYPEGGGQWGDIGTLGENKVLDTRKGEDGESVMLLPPTACVKAGERYFSKIDWDHRYTHMVFHAAQHLLSGTLYTAFGIGTVAVHLGPDYITIETDRNSIEQRVIEELELLVNKRVRENHRIKYYTLKHEDAEKLNLRRSIKVNTDVRIVEIEDTDKIACGGIHVNSTAEIGLILYTKQEIIREHVRLYFKAGESALLYSRSILNKISGIKNYLGTAEGEILSKIESLTQTVAQQKREIQLLSEKQAESEVFQYLKNGFAVFKTELDLSSFLKVIEKHEELSLFVYNEKNWLFAEKRNAKGEDSEANLHSIDVIDENGISNKNDKHAEFRNQCGKAKLSFNDIKAGLFSLASAKGGGRDGVYRGAYSNADGLEIFATNLVQKLLRLI